MTCHNVYSQMPECTKRNNTLPPRMFWYCMNCSACSRSSSDCDAKNLAKPSSPTCRQQDAYSAYVSLSAAACETCLSRADVHARVFTARMHPLIMPIQSTHASLHNTTNSSTRTAAKCSSHGGELEAAAHRVAVKVGKKRMICIGCRVLHVDVVVQCLVEKYRRRDSKL